MIYRAWFSVRSDWNREIISEDLRQTGSVFTLHGSSHLNSNDKLVFNRISWAVPRHTLDNYGCQVEELI